MLLDRFGQVVEDRTGIALRKQEMIRCFEAGLELAHIVIARYQHGLRRLIAYTPLRADVISGRQGQ